MADDAETIRRIEELNRKKAELEKAMKELEAEERRLKGNCPHRFDDPDGGAGTWCSLCGAYQLD